MWLRASVVVVAGLVLGCGSATEVDPASGTNGESGSTSAGGTTESTSGGTETTVGTSESTTVGTSESTTAGTSESTTTGTTDATTDASGSTGGGSTGSETTGVQLDHCENEQLDTAEGETDVDCGGPCDRCAYGQDCGVNGDCETAFCDTTCSVEPPDIWLDGDDTDTMYDQSECVSAGSIQNDEAIYCWDNKGTVGGTFRSQGSQGDYRNNDGIELTADTYLREDAFGGPLNSVTVFLVAEPTNFTSGDAVDFSLNDNPADAASRYAGKCGDGDDADRIWWDAGGEPNRVESGDSPIATGQQHIFTFTNSGVLAERGLYLDGLELDVATGAVTGTANDVSIGNGADTIVGEFLVYAPGLTNEAREVVEGELACRWNLRDELPMTHPYWAISGDSNGGCPNLLP